MKTITNVSNVTDYSGEPPVVTYSNPVTTVIRKTPPEPTIIRIFYRLPCTCFDCCRCDRCRCDRCRCDFCRNDCCDRFCEW